MQISFGITSLLRGFAWLPDGSPQTAYQEALLAIFQPVKKEFFKPYNQLQSVLKENPALAPAAGLLTDLLIATYLHENGRNEEENMDYFDSEEWLRMEEEVDGTELIEVISYLIEYQNQPTSIPHFLEEYLYVFDEEFIEVADLYQPVIQNQDAKTIAEIQQIWNRFQNSDLQPILLPLFLTFGTEDISQKLHFLTKLSVPAETILATALLNGLHTGQELPLP